MVVPLSAAAAAKEGAAPTDSRPRVSLDDLRGSLTALLQHSQGTDESAPHGVARAVLALQDVVAECGAVPPDLPARLAAVGERALHAYATQGQSSTEALLLEACLCSLAQLACEPGGVPASPPSAVPPEAVRLALQALSGRLSAAIASHSAAILASAAQSPDGWGSILPAWHAEAGGAGRGDAGALCEQLLVLICSHFCSRATTGTRVVGWGGVAVVTADQGGETCGVDGSDSGDVNAASAGVAVSSWAGLEAAEEVHQLESALTSCVQIAGFIGCAADAGGAHFCTTDAQGTQAAGAGTANVDSAYAADAGRANLARDGAAQAAAGGSAVSTLDAAVGSETVADKAARAEERTAALAAASSVAARTSLRARLLLIASGVEPTLCNEERGGGGGQRDDAAKRQDGQREDAATSEGGQRDEAAALSVCTRVAESAQTVLAILLAASGQSRPSRPCSLTELIAEVADRLAEAGDEPDPLLLSAVLRSFAAAEAAERVSGEVSGSAAWEATAEAEVVISGGDGGGGVRSSATEARATALCFPDNANAKADEHKRSSQAGGALESGAASQPGRRSMSAAPDNAHAQADEQKRSTLAGGAPGPATASQPGRRSMGAAALKLVADAAARAAPGSAEQVLAVRALGAACSVATPEAIHGLAPEQLSFILSVAHSEVAADVSDPGRVTDTAKLREAAEAAQGALEALRKGWVAAPDSQRQGVAGEDDGENSRVSAVGRLVDLAGRGAGGGGRLAAWALGALRDMARDPAKRPELIEGGALLLVASVSGLPKAAGRGSTMARSGTVKGQGLSRAQPAETTGARTIGPSGRQTQHQVKADAPTRQTQQHASVDAPTDASFGGGTSRSSPREKGRGRPMSAALAAWESEDTPDTQEMPGARGAGAMTPGSREAGATSLDSARLGGSGGRGGACQESQRSREGEMPQPPSANAPSVPTTARARADLHAPATQPKRSHADTRPGGATQLSPSHRIGATRATARGSSSASAAPIIAANLALSSAAGALRKASAWRHGEARVAEGDNGGHPSALAALRAWLTYSDADTLPSSLLAVPTSTLRVLCRLAGGAFEPNGVDADAASLAIRAVRALLGAPCDESHSNANRLRDLVLTEPRRAPAEPDPTACIEVMLSLLDEEAARPTKLDDSVLAPRLLRVLQGAVEHRTRMQSTIELDGPLIDRFSIIARFVTAAGSAGAGETLTARAVDLARALCEGWAGPRTAFLRERAALFATSSLLGHPAESVQQPAMRLLLSLSTGDRKAVASLVATGAVQASLDAMAKALLDPSPEAEDTAAAATSFLRNLVARERSLLRLLSEHPACEGIQWPKY